MIEFFRVQVRVCSSASDALVTVGLVAGAFVVFTSYKDQVELATLLVPAVKRLLEVVPVFDLVHLSIL